MFQRLFIGKIERLWKFAKGLPVQKCLYPLGRGDSHHPQTTLHHMPTELFLLLHAYIAGSWNKSPPLHFLITTCGFRFPA